MTDRRAPLPLSAFPVTCTEKLRYSDTDQQGHINNVVYGAFFESGRISLLHDRVSLLETGSSQIVLAQITINFLRELHWPGQVVIGTAVTRLGRSSVSMIQSVYREGEGADPAACIATAESAIVLIDLATRRGTPLPEDIRTILETCFPREP